jgi:hypothetical protein
LCNWNNEVAFSIGRYNISRGNLDRGFFLFLFVPAIGALVLFLTLLFTFQNDLFFIILSAFTLLGFLWIYLFYYIFSIISLSEIQRCQKIISIIILIIIFIIIPVYFAYFAILPFSTQFNPNDTRYHGNVKIIPINTTYSSMNSTSIGLPLTYGGYGANISDIDRYYWNFHWTTNYGHFIVSDPENHIVKIEGADVSLRYPSPTLYWMYDTIDQGKNKSPVIIYLRIENRLTKIVYSGDELNLNWSSIDTVTVET